MSTWTDSIDAQAERELATLEKVTGHNLRDVTGGAPRVELVNAADVRPERIRWLWPGWLARGKLHVIAGAPGTGKTTIAANLAACVSAGLAFPSGWKPTPGRVLIWSGEDDVADTLAPRLIAAGAELARVQFVGDVREGTSRYPFDPARDVPTLAAALAGVDDIALIVIDPLVSAVSNDSHKNAEVRRSLAPLVDLAAKVNAALIGITHYSKGTQGREPLERVTGSLAFGALARLVFGTVKQKADDDSAPSRYLLARVKSNIGPDGGAFAYAFEQTEIGHGIAASRIVFGEAVEGSARELLADAEADPDGEHSERLDAAEWLRRLLADDGMPAKAVKAEADQSGFAWRTVQRAMKPAGVESAREGFGKDAQYVWRLSGHARQTAPCVPCTPHKKVGAHGAHDAGERTDPAGGVEI